MSPTQPSKLFAVSPFEGLSQLRVGDPVRPVCGPCSRSRHVVPAAGCGPARASVSAATAQAGRVPAIGCIVGACGTARKPLASLGLGLTAALRVRFVRAVGAGSRLVRHTTRPE